MRVETGLLNPDSERYVGGAQAPPTIGDTAQAARAIEELGFDGACTPEAGHDPFLPLMIAAEHTRRLELGTNVAIAFPRSPMTTALLPGTPDPDRLFESLHEPSRRRIM